MGDERGELAAAPTAAGPSRARARVRLLVGAAVIAAVAIAVRTTGVVDSLSPESLRGLLAGAGVLGVVAFVVVYSIGLLAQLPGLLFIAVAVLAYGRTLGTLVALGGSVVAVSVSFFVVRRLGGRVLAEVESPLVRRLLAQLDSRPLRSVILLRAVFGVAPFLNYALALSSLGFRDYLIGSAIGMTPPIAIAAILLDAAL